MVYWFIEVILDIDIRDKETLISLQSNFSLFVNVNFERIVYRYSVEGCTI